MVNKVVGFDGLLPPDCGTGVTESAFIRTLPTCRVFVKCRRRGGEVTGWSQVSAYQMLLRYKASFVQEMDLIEFSSQMPFAAALGICDGLAENGTSCTKLS